MDVDMADPFVLTNATKPYSKNTRVIAAYSLVSILASFKYCVASNAS